MNLSLQNFEYFIVLGLSLSVPFLMLFHPRNPLRKDLKIAIVGIILTSLPWLVWDYFATARGHWSFNYDYLTGVKILNLPLEEILFFWVIPFNCLFLWTLFRDYKSFQEIWQKFLAK